MCVLPQARNSRSNVISVVRYSVYRSDMLPIKPLFVACLAFTSTWPAHAQSQGAGGNAITEMAVLPGWRTEQGTQMAALRIRLAPGWKTYWRAPGDAGIPPRFGWTGSENLTSVTFYWPRPEVYTINGMRSIGYYEELVLPMELTPAQPGEPIELRAEIELGVCQEICVPIAAQVSVDLSGEGGRDPAILAALAAQPDTAREASVTDVSCDIEPIRDGLRLTAKIDMARIGPDEVAVFELPDQSIWISEAVGRRDGQTFVATSDLVPPSSGPFTLDRSAVRITVFGKDRAVELEGCSAG